MASASELVILIRARDEAAAVMQRLQRQVGGLSGAMGGLGRAVTVGVTALAAVGAAAAATGFAFAKAAADEEASIARLNQAIRNFETDANTAIAASERWVEAGEELAFSDDTIRSSLALLIAQVGDYEEAQRRSAIAMDVSRGAGIDLETASRLLGKLTEENIQVFRRFGITIRDGATETEALAEIQARFSGQAEAFANTGAGAWARFMNEVNNVKEGIGAGLLPVFTDLFTRLADFLDRNQARIEEFGRQIGDFLVRAVDAAQQAFEDWEPVLREVAEMLEDVGREVRAFGGWLISNAPALAFAIAAIGIAFAWANPLGAVVLGIGALIGAMALLRAENTKLGPSALQAKAKTLEAFIGIRESFFFNLREPLSKLPGWFSASIGPAARQSKEELAALKTELEEVERALDLQASTDAAARGLINIANAAAFGIPFVDALRREVLALLTAGDLLAAAKLGFRTGLPPAPPAAGPTATPPFNVGAISSGAAAAANNVADLKNEFDSLLRARVREGVIDIADAIALATGNVADLSSAMRDLLPAAAAAGVDAAGSLADALIEEAQRLDQIQDIIAETIASGVVRIEDAARLLTLGAPDIAQDFVNALEGEFSAIGFAIFGRMVQEANTAGIEAAAAFAEAFQDNLAALEGLIEGMLGQIQGLAGQLTQEEAQLRLGLAHLEAERLTLTPIAEEAQRDRQARIAEFEAQLAGVRSTTNDPYDIRFIEEQIAALRNERTWVEKRLEQIDLQTAAIEHEIELRRKALEIETLQAAVQSGALPTHAELVDKIREQAELWQGLIGVFDRLAQGIVDVHDVTTVFQAGLSQLAEIMLLMIGGLVPIVPLLPPHGLLPSFHHGGIVPGAAGTERLIRAQAGERVLPAGTPAVMNVYVSRFVFNGSPREAAEALGMSVLKELG